MDQNNVDNELQKAIDEITNTTNESGNPFEATTPTDFSYDLAEPSEDFAEANLPLPDMTGPMETAGPFEAPAPAAEPQLQPEVNAYYDASFNAEPAVTDTSTAVATTGVTASNEMTGAQLDDANELKDVQDAALRDLIPMLDEITEITPSEKYELCRRAYETSRDPMILKKALESAKNISDAKERATALLYIVKAN